MAEQVLDGVGDATLGEWQEIGDIAVHLRRRLTEAEAARVGPVVDVRRTKDGMKRRNAMRRYLPAAFHQTPMDQWP